MLQGMLSPWTLFTEEFGQYSLVNNVPPFYDHYNSVRPRAYDETYTYLHVIYYTNGIVSRILLVSSKKRLDDYVLTKRSSSFGQT